MLAIPKAISTIDSPGGAVGLSIKAGKTLSIRKGGDAILGRIAGAVQPSARRRARIAIGWPAGRPAAS